MDSPPNTLWLRCAAFAMHAAAALAVAVVLFQCNTAQYSDTGYHMLPLAWQAPNAMGPNSTWSGPTTLAQAVRNGIPWADDEPLAHHRWNPFGLVLIFEDQTGRQVDFDLRGSLDEVLAKALPVPAKSGPGRPKLGVISREISPRTTGSTHLAACTP